LLALRSQSDSPSANACATRVKKHVKTRVECVVPYLLHPFPVPVQELQTSKTVVLSHIGGVTLAIQPRAKVLGDVDRYPPARPPIRSSPLLPFPMFRESLTMSLCRLYTPSLLPWPRYSRSAHCLLLLDRQCLKVKIKVVRSCGRDRTG